MNCCLKWLRLLMVASCGGLAAAASAAPTLPDQSYKGSLGVASCASSLCHGSIAVWKGSAVRQNEYVIWSRLDKHARAHTLLLNDKSREIASKLGLKVPAHEAAVCVDCHAHNPRAPRPGHQVSDGVACEACHGPSESWLKSHVEPGATHQKNLAAGLYPTADPIARARLCLSCHFGTKDKYVTHRIMAAGHPRLSFELETFTQLQPAHFNTGAAYVNRKGQPDGVRIWAVGQAIAVSTLMDMMSDERRGRDGVFPELTLFDCHACHHPMRDRRWKQGGAFGKSLAPGLVRVNDSGMLMLRLILRQVDAGLGNRLELAVRRLNLALAGNGSVDETARQLKTLSDAAARMISDRGFDAKLLRNVALALVDDGLGGHYTDYADAEQAFMALGAVTSTLHRLGHLPSATALNRAIAELRTVLADDEAFNPATFQARLRLVRPLVSEAAYR